MERIHADGCGLRSVAPQTMPSSHRSEAYANSPVTLSVASGRRALSPTPVTGVPVYVVPVLVVPVSVVPVSEVWVILRVEHRPAGRPMRPT